MSKYIDAKKLITEIKARQSELVEHIKTDTSSERAIDGSKTVELQWVLDIIDSLQQEQLEVDFEKEIEEHVEGMPMSEFTHESEVDIHYDWARKEFRHFFELGQQEMRHRIMNPEYNAKVIEQLKSEHPTIKIKEE